MKRDRREEEIRGGQDDNNRARERNRASAGTLGKSVIDQEPQAVMGRIRKKTEMAGVGRLSQVAGIVIFLGSLGAFPIGTAVGLLIMISLFIIGRRMATKYYCGICGEPVDSKKVKTCPSCEISLR